MFHRSPLPDIALPETTLFALLESDSPALTEIDTGRSVTYAELRALALGTCLLYTSPSPRDS